MIYLFSFSIYSSWP